MGTTKKVAALQTANKTEAETSAVVNTEKMATSSANKTKELRNLLLEYTRRTDSLGDYDVVIGYIITYFIKLVAKNYAKFFNDTCVTSLTCIGVNYEDSYITTYNSDGDPIKTKFIEGDYNLPEFEKAIDKWAAEDNISDIFDAVYAFLFADISDYVDEDVHAEMINTLEKYIAEAWDVKEVKLTLEFGYTKIDVTR